MDDLAAVGQATLTSLARAGENTLSFLLGGDQPARSTPRRRIGLDSADGVGSDDVFSRATPSPDEKNLRRGSSAGTGRWPPPHLYQPRPGNSSGGGGYNANNASASPSFTTSSQQRQQRQQPWHLRVRAVARAHAASLRDVAAMRFAYVDPDARWRPRGGGMREGDENEDEDDGSVAVVVVVAAHVRPRSVTRREALLHSVLVADRVLGVGGDRDDDDHEEEDGEEEDAGGGRGSRSVSESVVSGGDDEQQQEQQSSRRKKKKKPPRPRDFVLVLFGASATVPALSYDAQFFAELHAALPPSHRDPERMRAFYVVHAGWGLRAWLAALRLSEPGIYGRAEFVASLRDLERQFGGDSGRIPRPPEHVVAADAKRVAAAAAAGQIL